MGISDSTDLHPRLRPITRLYLLIVVIWLVFVALLVSFVIKSELETSRQQFQRQADALFQQVSNKVEINDSVIEGFASLLATRRQYEWNQIRNYARRILERYPHIYNFEVVRKVRQDDLPAFVDSMRQNLYPGFRIANFDFSDRRQWVNVTPHDIYYPIVFVEPLYADNRPVLGLDIGTNPIFRDALQRSARLRTPVATRPFSLLEGPRGYLLQRAITVDSLGDGDLSGQFAVLVIKARNLLPESLLEKNELAVRLYHQEYVDDMDNAELYYKSDRAAGELETLLFPRLEYKRVVNNSGQPFVFMLERQVRFDDVNMALVTAILVIAVISFWTVMVFSKMHHRHELERLQYENQLYRLANNDSLTGLANRNFLIDRMRQVMAKARRKGTRFALVFMDMNNFKQVNDQFGHAAGDELLVDIATRFRECMREEDTVCRYQGDEFVILLDEIRGQDETRKIYSKLLECLQAPFIVSGKQVQVAVSIGIAVFPDEGESIDELFQVADEKMYRKKKGSE